MNDEHRDTDRHLDEGGPEESRLQRAAGHARDALDRARDGVAAGASGLAEVTRKGARDAAEQVGRAAEFVREARPDEELKHRVHHGTEDALRRAGNRLAETAPSIGRGAEAAAAAAARGVGGVLRGAAHPLGVALGAIAGTLGGWWHKAARSDWSLPEAEDEACRAHFATITAHPAGMSYERARTGYALGYLAALNPDAGGRGFDEVEPELRRGFGGADADEFELLREYARFGYGRGGAGGGSL